MKILIPGRSIILLALAVLVFLFSSSAFSQSANNSTNDKSWQHLKYAIYFTSYDIERLLSDSTQFKKTMEYFAPIKAERVYLEGTSRGKVNVELLKKLSDKFKALGFKVSGSMVPVSPKGGTSTYNNSEDLASLKNRMQALAKVFDNIILDDWLFTTATDPKSIEDRGSKSWAEYRTKLLLEQSKKYIIDPAKEVNPGVNVIIKYPNWYEGFPENGYDVYKETHQFDKMAVGIETRVPETQDQHIPTYSGYIFQKWYSSVDPSKWIGSWLDNYGMKGAYNDYNAEVWQAVFARSPEIIFWCAGQLYPPNPSSDIYPHFIKELPEFNRVSALLKGESRGVPIYLPYGSTGEYNIFGYLGMAGIPLTPVAEFPKESENAIFTLQSLKDKNLASEMMDRLKNGKDVFMTWGLWKKLKDTDFNNTLSFVDYGGTVSSDEFRIYEPGFREREVKVLKTFSFESIRTTTWPGDRRIALIKKDYDYGILFATPYYKGTMYVLNLPDDYYDLLELPDEALNTIRSAFNKELGFELDGPAHVGIYLFGDNQYVLYNMENKDAEMSLKFTRKIPTEGWKELVQNVRLKVEQNNSFVKYGGTVISTISLKLRPFEVAVVQAP